MTTKEFAKILQDKLTSEYGVDLSVASHQQIYCALALICRQMMSENHQKFQSKAIGTGVRGFSLADVELLRQENGKPYLRLQERAKTTAEKAGFTVFSVSVTHTREYAAVAVLAYEG